MQYVAATLVILSISYNSLFANDQKGLNYSPTAPMDNRETVAKSIDLPKNPKSVNSNKSINQNKKSKSRKTGKGPLITDISIRGHANTAPQVIKLAIGSNVGDRLSKEQVADDISSIYKLGYFQSPPRPSTEPFGAGIRLIYNVIENPAVESLKIKGNTLIPTEVIQENMTTQIGSVLNIRQLYEDLSTISNLYRKKGFIYSGIYNPGKQVSIEGTHITVNIKESRINRIRVEGNKKTRDYVIMRELLMEEGQVVNRERISDSLRNLRNLDFFELEQPEIILNPDTGDTDVTLNLQDVKTGTASFGGGYSSINGFIGFVDATERNFRGKGQALRVKTQFGGEQAYELAFTEPYFKGRKQAIGGSIFRSILDRDDIRNQSLFARFEERREGFSLFTTQRKRKDESLTYRFIDERIKTDLIAGNPSSLYDDHQQTIGITWIMDKRDNFQYPTKGYRHSVTFSTTGGLLAGINNFNKYSYEYRRYWQNNFIKRNTLALRVKGGLAQELDGFIPYIDLWSVGGSNSIRGYEDREFVGEKMFYSNLEMRYKISKQFTAALFTDIGSAWDGVASFDLRSAFGVGIRFKTPLGPFRLDFAKATDRDSNQVHFGIGSMF